MIAVNLTQAEADTLIAMEKRRIDETEWNYPDLDGHVAVPLASTDRCESFLFDLRRRRLDLDRETYQNCGRWRGLFT